MGAVAATTGNGGTGVDGTGAGDTGIAGTGTGATGLGSGIATGGTRRTDSARPAPGRKPGMPNCSDNTSACSSTDTSTPPTSRRSDGSIEEALDTALTLAMPFG